MEMTVSEIVSAKVKALIAAGAITDVDIQLAVDETAQCIRTYCNIDVSSILPVELNFTHANMAVDLLKYTHASNTAGADTEVDAAEVSSIKIGDTQIQLGGASTVNERASALRSHSARLDTLIMNYKDQLNKFKRMVW
jgi:hypothetical protein